MSFSIFPYTVTQDLAGILYVCDIKNKSNVQVAVYHKVFSKQFIKKLDPFVKDLFRKFGNVEDILMKFNPKKISRKSVYTTTIVVIKIDKIMVAIPNTLQLTEEEEYLLLRKIIRY